MAGFFDYLSERGVNPNRLNARHRHIIEPVKDDIPGARVLDLGSYYGRWPYAWAAAGAAHVLGIEGRADQIARFDEMCPDAPFKKNIELVCGDMVEETDRLIAAGRTFDIISCLGVFYHTMEHYRMLKQFVALKPKLIVIDSSFSTLPKPVMEIGLESTSYRKSSIETVEGQEKAPIGHISKSALRVMAKSLGLSCERVQWSQPSSERQVKIYYPGRHYRRAIFHLRPVAAPEKAASTSESPRRAARATTRRGKSRSPSP